MSNRIGLNMSLYDVIYELSEGNPGAMEVIMHLIEHKFQGMPDGTMHLLSLDSCEIYGSNIWVLYKDICNENLDLVCLVLRAFHFGTFSKEEIAEVIKENLKERGARKLVSADIEVDKDVYDAKNDNIGDHKKFEEYLKKQREFFESQQSALGG